MSSSASAFQGAVPAYYDRYLSDLLFDPYAADLVARVPVADGLRVLEIACGTGIVTRRLRAALPDSARLVATDLNEAMTTYADTSLRDPSIEWRQADAEALPFEDGSFDVAVCQFGFMFLPDKVQGFREARRVLAPGGLLLGNIWHGVEQNRGAAVIEAALARMFPDDPPQFLRTPYGYGDAARIRGDMEAAGWTDAQLDDVRLSSESPSAQDVAIGYTRGTPLSHDLTGRGVDVDAVIEELASELVPVGGEAPYRAEHAAIVITARR